MTGRSQSGPPIPRQRRHENGSSALTDAGGRLGTQMTKTIQRVEHLHARPAWDCRVCDEPWPCANAKTNLLAEFRGFPSVLTIYLSGQMYDALDDLTSHGEHTPADLYERFIAWIR